MKSLVYTLQLVCFAFVLGVGIAAAVTFLHSIKLMA